MVILVVVLVYDASREERNFSVLSDLIKTKLIHPREISLS